ncbi:MAG: hypothetical protein M3N08_03180 [Pseudomonadota bacterium]|nr:hypothetical protein [Pseudomonadota bacterium]
MTALPLGLFKWRLMDVARQLYLDHGWPLPSGFTGRDAGNGTNFSYSEHLRALRVGCDLPALKRRLQQASADGVRPVEALREEGFTLARGDQGGYVAVDAKGGIYTLRSLVWEADTSLLPPLNDCPNVLGARLRAACNVTTGPAAKVDAGRELRLEQATRERQSMVARHQRERRRLDQRHKMRWQIEQKLRCQRLPRGLVLLWNIVSGRYDAVRSCNEREVKAAARRDRGERQVVIDRQLQERRELSQRILRLRDKGGLLAAVGRKNAVLTSDPSHVPDQATPTARKGKRGKSEGGSGSGGLERRGKPRDGLLAEAPAAGYASAAAPQRGGSAGFLAAPSSSIPSPSIPQKDRRWRRDQVSFDRRG